MMPAIMSVRSLLPLIAVALLAGAARAETSARPAAAWTPPAMSRISDLNAAVLPSSQTPANTGFAKTAIDHSFAQPGLVGSLGYLCGIDKVQPRYDAGGPASTYGRAGTFLGAKISYAF